MKFRAGYVFLAAIMLAAFSGLIWAQMGRSPGRGGMMMQQRDPVALLNRMLASSGGAQLSESQQQQLTALVNDYRSAGDNSVQDRLPARKDLENAILSKDETALDSAADALANQLATTAGDKIREIGRFEIKALTILTDDQVNALRNQYGNSGLIHALGAMAGAGFHRGFGGGMMHGGRGWQR